MRLIDSEKVHGHLIEYAYNHQHEFGFHWGDIIKFTPSQVSEIFAKMPTIDAVPVVRCKDCKHRYIENMTWHCPFGLMGGEDFFCGYGSLGRAERRSDDAD